MGELWLACIIKKTPPFLEFMDALDDENIMWFYQTFSLKVEAGTPLLRVMLPLEQV